MGVNTMCTKTKGINTEMSPSCVLTLKLHVFTITLDLCLTIHAGIVLTITFLAITNLTLN